MAGAGLGHRDGQVVPSTARVRLPARSTGVTSVEQPGPAFGRRRRSSCRGPGTSGVPAGVDEPARFAGDHREPGLGEQRQLPAAPAGQADVDVDDE